MTDRAPSVSPADDSLETRIDEIARTPLLLLASDFDGTIAPIVADPASAEADRESLVALRALAAMPQTHVAIVSGRALSDLARRTREMEEAHLVGSHGSEYEVGFATPISPEAAELHKRLAQSLRALAARDAGMTLEEKPASLAFHYRNAAEQSADRIVAEIEAGPARWPGVHVRRGKKVIELSVVETNKGMALKRIRQQVGATAVVFIGDDITDEDAFQTLSGPDISIKVGEGETAARHRVRDTTAVARLLARLAERRAEWIAGSRATPIDQHSMLSDQRTIALLDSRGRLVWMCLPRIDSSALFAELLGGPTAGYFEISPITGSGGGGGDPQQRYLDDSFTLETCWPTLRVIDYLDCGAGRAFQRAGRTDLIRVIEGTGPVRIVFAPRLDFGRVETKLELVPAGVHVVGLVDSLVLYAPNVQWQLVDEGRHQSAVAEIELSDRPLVLEMRYGTANLQENPNNEPLRRQRAAAVWENWLAPLTLPKLARTQVARSALILKALCYGPTGAIAAAGTTSLPEHLGGSRNWDYRFCWPRDSAMAATALLRLGAPGPGLKLLDWVLGILDSAGPGALIAPLYSVSGTHLGPEAEIGDLAGYHGSRPVRVGNAAANQVQLDVFGPVAELVAQLADRGAPLSSEHWRLVESMVTAVSERWSEPDHGIWEVRRPRQHHVHSKVNCWQTIDRALRVAGYLGQRRPQWIEKRDEIARDLLLHGWNQRLGTFCATYHGDEPDASALAVGLTGLLAADDPRFRATVEFVERELRVGPVVYRYRYDDNIPGAEGGFHLCTTWLIEALTMIGRLEEAHKLFDDYLELMGPTGLLSEEYDPEDGVALGNIPQAYSHLGLINAALCLERRGAH